jgi:Cu/Zn superoxide dismutase
MFAVTSGGCEPWIEASQFSIHLAPELLEPDGENPNVMVQQLSKRAFANTLFNPQVAVLRGDSKVSGIVTFEQSSESSPTTITYDITGNDPNAERGMHVHQFGDNTNGCTSAGPHCTSIPPIPARNGKDYLVLVDTDLL